MVAVGLAREGSDSSACENVCEEFNDLQPIAKIRNPEETFGGVGVAESS